MRSVERAPARVRAFGRIYHIDRTLSSFGVEFERDGDGPAVDDAVYFDVDDGAARRRRDAAEVCERARDVTWRVALRGKAEVRDDTLVAVGPPSSLA